MSTLFTRAFWVEAADRAIKSAAHGVILGLGLGEGLNAFAVDWQLALGFAAGGAVLSILTSIANAGARRASTAQSIGSRDQTDATATRQASRW